MIGENFLFGLQALFRSINLTVTEFVQLDLIQGVFLGFLLATLIHMIVYSDRIRYFRSYVFGDPALFFEEVHNKFPGEGYMQSYMAFKKALLRVRFALYLTIVVFLLLIVLVVFRYS